MRVEVRLYGFVRDVASDSTRSVELPARSTLRDLLNEIVNQFGARLRGRLFTNTGGLETNVQIFVGPDRVAALEQPLADGQADAEVKIFVLSATAGG